MPISSSRRPLMRSTALATGLTFVLWTGAASAQSQTFNFDLPKEALSQALRDYARISGQQIIFTDDLVAGRQSPALRGALTAEDALAVLLKGTDLAADLSPSGALMIHQKEARDGTRPKRLGDASQAAPSESGVEEIVVTAQKREERLKDVPVPVTVLHADTLADNGQVLLRDYYASIPGLVVTPTPGNQQILSIRGITTGDSSTATVGVLIDDMPFGLAAGLGSAGLVPDIDPGDLERIEVLRGPQGTLYGANSMGGTVKYVTKDPSFEGYSGRVEAGVSTIHNSAEPGFNLRAAANMPISDIFAIRLSGFDRQDGGYIDNPVLNLRGINEGWADGMRLVGLLEPSEGFSIKLAALYQHTRTTGNTEVVVQPGLGDLQQNYGANTGGYNQTIQAYSVTIKADLGLMDIASVSGYNSNKFDFLTDFTWAQSSLNHKYFGVTGSPFRLPSYGEKFTQEIRLSGLISDNLEWLVGAYYTRENSRNTEYLLATDFFTGRVAGAWWYYNNPMTFDEYAGFADLTYHITDRFDVQVGGRESHVSFAAGPIVQTGLWTTVVLGLPDPSVTPRGQSEANSFTYLATPRFKVSPDMMIYARFASGFRPGGPNNAALNVPRQYQPDKTQNYEIGMKTDFFDHMLSLDTSFYYIDWQNIQIQTRAPNGLVYSGNGSGAKSEGVEFSVTSRPLTGLTIAGWVSYDDAVLTQAFGNSPVYGAVGNRLPFSSQWSGKISAKQEFALPFGANGFLAGDVSFVGDRVGFFVGTPQRQYYPAYTRVDVRAGVTYESWTASIYINNATDERGIISGGIGDFYRNAFHYIQPRAFGGSLSMMF